MKVQVVKDVFDVFLEELPELSPEKEIEFGIDVPKFFKKKKVRSVEGNSRTNFLKGENCKTLEFMKLYMISKIEV